MAVVFACSFDAGTPLGGWTSTSNTSIVTGRNANGCQITTGGSLNKTAACGAICTAGVAYRTTAFSNAIIFIFDPSTNGGFAKALHKGDGRMILNLGCGAGQSNTTLNGFAANIGLYAYYELSVTIVQVVTPVDGTHSNVQITVNATLYVNNQLIGSASDVHILLNILNVDIPAGTFGAFTIQSPGGGTACVVDDVYINATRIGDAKVQSDDSTVTVETAAPDITQSLLEIGIQSTVVMPDITQSLIEVGIGELFPQPSLTCPVDSGSAVVGVFYSAFLIATGGTPPYTYAIIEGALPPGLTLNATTGEISGVPTTIGVFNYVAQVTDANGQTAHT